MPFGIPGCFAPFRLSGKQVFATKFEVFIAVFKIKGTVKRTDFFGIAPSFPVAVVSDEISIDANVELNKSTADNRNH